MMMMLAVSEDRYQVKMKLWMNENVLILPWEIDKSNCLIYEIDEENRVDFSGDSSLVNLDSKQSPYRGEFSTMTNLLFPYFAR